MSVRPRVRAQAAYPFTARAARIKLDQNESPYDVPPHLKDAIFERLKSAPWNRYPELAAQSLRERLAAHHAWDARGVVVANGSNVLIQAFVAACGIEQRVLTVKPSFSVYSDQARLLGAPLTEVPLGGAFSLPLAELERNLEHPPGVLFLANPAAPTGNAFLPEAVERLLEVAAPDWTVVIDEAYHQFAASDAGALVRQYPNAASLRTLSKAFGLGGVRLGYALTSPELAENIQKVLLPFSVSALQVATGLTVLEHPELVAARVAEVITERERLLASLQALPNLSVYPSQTNFLLFQVPDAEGFFTALLGEGVLVRRQDHLPGLAGCLRVSVGTPAENDAFISAAQKASERVMVRG